MFRVSQGGSPSPVAFPPSYQVSFMTTLHIGGDILHCVVQTVLGSRGKFVTKGGTLGDPLLSNESTHVMARSLGGVCFFANILY